MKIYFIRHGQTKWNNDKRWQGAQDIELDETGLAQAALVAQKLKNVKITKVYSSDLSRAYETAVKIGEAVNAPIVADEALRETCLGDWEGLNYTQIKERDLAYFENWELNPSVPAPGKGGESIERTAERMAEAVKGYAKAETGDFAVVSHNAIIRAFVCKVLGIDLARRMLFDIGNASVSTLTYNPENGLFRVNTLNDTTHMSGYSDL